MQSLIGFFTKLIWQPASDAEKLGFAFMYDEEGTLIAETGTGGANSTGSTQYIYLPTPNGPMPIAAVINGEIYAVHSDHLNTPRRLTNAQGQPVWQWAYSAFGDEKPTLAKNRFANLEMNPNPGMTNISAIEFNLGYPGTYRDKESNLLYNYFRSYCPSCGRYTQPDLIGLDGGWNRFGYANQDPLTFVDPQGLLIMSTLGGLRRNTTLDQAATYGSPGNAASMTGLAGSLGGGAAAAAGVVYLTKVPAPMRTAMGLLRGLGDDAIAPPTPPQPPVPTPPAIVRPGGFNPPAPPPNICPRF